MIDANELRPAHEVMVAEIKDTYEFHSTWNEREQRYKAIHNENPPFRLLLWIEDQSNHQIALEVLCLAFEKMIIPQDKLPWVVAELQSLLDSDIYDKSPVYKKSLNEILLPTIETLSKRLETQAT